MFGGKILLAGYTTLALVLFSVNCYANHNCVPSCGNNDNITHPFRLKGDPKDCGDEAYELECENNRTVLYFLSGKYYVEEINYDNYTIRVVDVGIHKDDCSSLPLHSLTQFNFSNSYPYDLRYADARSPVVFMNCVNPVTSPLYIDNNNRGSCTKGGGNSSGSVKGQYLYVVVGGELKVSDVADLCTVEMMVPIAQPLLSMRSENRGNISFLNVHDAMVYGFDLYFGSYYFRGSYFGDYYFRNCLRHRSFFHCILQHKFLVVAAVIFAMYCVLIAICCVLRLKKREDQAKIERFLEDYKALKPARYSFADIRNITNKFKDKIGQGGYGTVYKGKLSNDVHVAVKILDHVKGNGDDFINEVGTIGTIHHINVVRLVGYCADGFKRALVYEFLSNHSLEKFISSKRKKNSLGWEKLHDIALGIAKGIDYLHQGCNQRILHFDIKPHNILLDHNFNPKISDFGLAKLCSKEQSVVSMTAARGTVGYIAPEVFSRNFGKVSCKSDVYSFGMLLLEMVGVRNNNVTQNKSEVYFPEWIYNRLDHGEDLEIQIDEDGDAQIAKKLTIVGLWCIHWYPVDRPSMKVVVQMLEGDGGSLTMPSNPFASANPMRGRLLDSELEEISESESFSH